MSERVWSIEWRGTITRDVGWNTIVAPTLEEARETFLRRYGNTRAIVGIIEVEQPA